MSALSRRLAPKLKNSRMLVVHDVTAQPRIACAASTTGMSSLLDASGLPETNEARVPRSVDVSPVGEGFGSMVAGPSRPSANDRRAVDSTSGAVLLYLPQSISL